MNQIELDMMKGMVSILNEASEAYYAGNPIMTDKQFDARLEDLKQFEKETGFILSNSPTQNVGAKVLTELKEVTHSHPMLSLEKCHTTEELIKFANNKCLVASIKLDGLTCSLTYENGVLVLAETRGNGIVGNDITEHVKQFKNIPLKINKNGTYIIDGEAIITDEDFAEVNKNNEYKNSRNLAAGTLSVLDTSLVSKRKLSFFAWDIINGDSNSLVSNLIEAAELGFNVVPYWSNINLEPKKLQNTIDYVFEYAKEEGLPCDGIVFKFSDIEYGKSLGATSHHFRNGIAYKAANELYKTELTNIEFTMGKTGILTPTAVFKSVEIDGTSVERASLSNLSIMEETLGTPFVGEEIFVAKRNMIIPKVESAYKIMFPPKESIINVPSICPVCGGATEIRKDNDSKVLICTNDNCKGKLLGKLTHFVSKNAMNIDRLSEATLEKFIELGWLTRFEDIYHLKAERNKMIKLEGFGAKSVEKLLNSIEKSKNTTLDRFIYALSIPLIGRSASKAIGKYFNGDFERFYEECCMNSFDFTVLNDFGKTMNESISEYIENNIIMISNIAKYMTFKKQQTVSGSNLYNSNLTNKNIVITGSLNYFNNRDELQKIIENLGGKVVNSINTKTYLLINNDINSNSSKNKKAKELNIDIITEEEFLRLINNGEI